MNRNSWKSREFWISLIKSKSFWTTLIHYAFLAIVINLVLNYFTRPSKEQDPGFVKIGVSVSAEATTTQDVSERKDPLLHQVKFDQASLQDASSITVETKLVTASFNTKRAVLSSLDFQEHRNAQGLPLNTLYLDANAMGGLFFLAFQDESPASYEFAGKELIAEKTFVRFKTAFAGYEISKVYVLYDNSYKIDLNLSFKALSDNAQVLKPRVIFQAPFLKGLGLPLKSKDAKTSTDLGEDTTTLFAWNEESSSFRKLEFAGNESTAWFWNASPLFGAEDRYFVHALIEDKDSYLLRAFVGDVSQKAPTLYLQGKQVDKDASYQLSFYVGPKVYDHLHAVDSRLEDLLSFGWLSWLCKLLLQLLDYIYDRVGNYGLAIIIMTIVIKLPFVPLSMYGRQKMEIFQRYQPAIARIRNKYKHDMATLNAELMRFYKEHNLSPTAQLSGCLPLLIQMPILFALYRVLNNYLDLYHAPFFGWIVDLSSKDPYYVIPVLMGLTMIWQQTSSSTGDGRQRTMMIFMSIFMTALFANFPAGLVLYWFMNNLLSVMEDYLRKAIWRS